jgi:ParB family chromosome partitioning protein
MSRPESGPAQVDVDKIHPNRAQPRTEFVQEHLEELAASLRRDGLLQPIIVRPLRGDEYELIAGERRWRAAQMAGLLKVPVIVKHVANDRLLELALIENLQREELNPLEEANAFQTLVNELGLTQQEVADRVGKHRATVANALRLLNLPVEVQQLVRQGSLSSGHAKALAALTNPRMQIDLAERIVREGLPVRAVEALVADRAEAPRKRVRARPDPHDPNVLAAEEELQRHLGTKVRILQNASGRGRVEIHFHSEEELDRVYELIRAN